MTIDEKYLLHSKNFFGIVLLFSSLFFLNNIMIIATENVILWHMMFCFFHEFNIMTANAIKYINTPDVIK